MRGRPECSPRSPGAAGGSPLLLRPLRRGRGGGTPDLCCPGVNRAWASVVDGGVFVGAVLPCTTWCSPRIWLPLIGAAGAGDGSVGVSLRGRRGGDAGLVFWDPCPRALCRCIAVSSVVDAGLPRYVCRRASGSSSLSSAGEGAKLAVPPLSSSSSCGYEETEIYDFSSMVRSPKSRSSCVPGGSNDGDAAAARPGSTLELEDGGLPEDLSVIFKFFGVVVYCCVW